MGVLRNLVAFQLCWFASVLGAAHGIPWIGPLVTAAWLVAHVRGQQTAVSVEMKLVLVAAVLGWFADSALVLAGLVAFPEPARLGGPSPLWMVGLWAALGATLRHSLGWLRGRWVLACAFGAIGGPAAYLGGQALGAISVMGTVGAVAVGVQYALATPLLLAVLKRLEKGAVLAVPAREARG
jgi:hypothetical protein